MADRELLDTDGENRAVRSFLMVYGNAGLMVGEMQRHMQACGYPYWPEWVPTVPTSHLTKGGAQDWLRYLFGLEGQQQEQRITP